MDATSTEIKGAYYVPYMMDTIQFIVMILEVSVLSINIIGKRKVKQPKTYRKHAVVRGQYIERSWEHTHDFDRLLGFRTTKGKFNENKIL